MPQPESFAKCACQHCGANIEFPPHGAGRKIACPHCAKPTLLFLSENAPMQAHCGCDTRRRIYLALAIVVGALAAGGGAYYYFAIGYSSQEAAAPIRPLPSSNASPVVSLPVPPPKPKPPLDPWHGLHPGQVALEKVGDGRLIYAIGTLTNATARQRFGVKVELDVLDEHHNKIGSATDYAEVIEPGKEWKFRAMVTDKTAAAARLTNVKEQQ